jgi:CubicO group peptidase (beta-lactamase class C family)
MDLPHAPDPALTDRLTTVIDRAIADKHVVGTVVLVARQGRLVFRRAAGVADREANRPMAETTIFRLASVTKPIVTVATLRLVEDGRIGLDDPITRWLPAFRPRLPDGTRPEIRLRHLLSHTAGLSYGFLEPLDGPYRRAGVSDGLGEPGLSLAENLRRIASVPLSYAPGTAWRYSVAMDVLGAALEAVTGESLPVVIERLVCRPLGLTDLAFTVADVDRLAAAYADAWPEPARMGEEMAVTSAEGTTTFAPNRIFDADSFPSGGSGMAGTAPDVLTVLETIRRGGAPLLSAASVRVLFTDHAGTAAQTQGPGWGFGFGGAILDDPQAARTPQSKGTLQWGGAYGHSWFIDPVRELTVVALTNTAFEGVLGAFPLNIRDAVYG